MKTKLLGDAIREHREALGLSQGQLCEGLCSSATVSRLERGEHTPSHNLIGALLQRLGMPDNRYFALLGGNEEEIEALKTETRAGLINWRKASAEDRPQVRAETLETLRRLEEIAEPDDQITRQHILSVKVQLGKEDGPYSPSEQIDLLTQALRLTVPRFDPDDVGKRLYSADEIRLVNQIAMAHALSEDNKRAVDLYDQLLKYIQQHNQHLSTYAGQMTLVASNYAHELVRRKRYLDAIEVAELGRSVCTSYGHYQFLPSLLCHLAESHFFEGNLELSRKLYLQSACLFETFDDRRNLALILADMKERLDLELPF